MSTKRQLSIKWEEYVKNLKRETPVPKETESEKEKRIASLKKNFIKFCKFYFPNYCTAEFAAFQKRFARRVIKNDVIYIVQAWSREHAKSVVSGLFLPAYLMFTGRMHNMLLVSHSFDNACELLAPLMLNLEHNQRILNDYGKQKSYRGWETGRFVTRSGCSFRAIGAGQSPRGTRNEEKRPDFILIDDIDTDEESRNQVRINKKWDWVEQALFPAMSISGTKRFIIVGNIISKESIVVKASKVADHFDQVNILDSKGRPSWKERYSMEDIDYMLSKISYASGQKEYFNNPIVEGTVFKDITWGKVPPLSRFKFLVAYGDPSYKSSKKNDFKAVPLVGEYKGVFYVITAYIEQTTTGKMIQWYDHLKKYVDGKTAIYNYIENGGLQDTFYSEIFLPKLIDYGKKHGHLAISPDNRKKGDKFVRIEAALEPINTQGRLVFNVREQENPHMKRLEDQFKAFAPNSAAHDDGPDAVEGAVWIINNKLRTMKVDVKSTRRSKYKF